MVATAQPSKPTLSPGYTVRRPIRVMSATARAFLHPMEALWVSREWATFTGSMEDEDFNVIMERVTPVTHTRIWVCDRDGEDSSPILILPEDY